MRSTVLGFCALLCVSSALAASNDAQLGPIVVGTTKVSNSTSKSGHKQGKSAGHKKAKGASKFVGGGQKNSTNATAVNATSSSSSSASASATHSLSLPISLPVTLTATDESSSSSEAAPTSAPAQQQTVVVVNGAVQTVTGSAAVAQVQANGGQVIGPITSTHVAIVTAPAAANAQAAADVVQVTGSATRLGAAGLVGAVVMLAGAMVMI